jgi:hypothetical protein
MAANICRVSAYDCSLGNLPLSHENPDVIDTNSDKGARLLRAPHFIDLHQRTHRRMVAGWLPTQSEYYPTLKQICGEQLAAMLTTACFSPLDAKGNSAERWNGTKCGTCRRLPTDNG